MVTGSDGELSGQRLGHYQLEGLLGRGGMAEVYRARELPLGRAVAVKVLPTKLAHDHGYVARFRAEAQSVAALHHPHIVPVYFYSEQAPLLYLVMPILDESLRDRLDREGLLDPHEATRICQEIASALEAAHQHGLIHRDVKPENILLDGAGAALLTDFGIARAVSRANLGRAQTLTSTGLPVGTPEYMAPELLRNETVDARTDIYALGAVLYELLTGRAPHEAETPLEVAARALLAPIVPPSRYRLAIWPALDEVIMTALAAKPNARFQSVTAFAVALARALELADSDATMTGRTNAPIDAAQPLLQLQLKSKATNAIAEASTVPPIVAERSQTSARSQETWWRAQSKWRWGIAIATTVALLVVTVFMTALLRAYDAGTQRPSTSASSGGVPAATVTAISAALATAIAEHTPGAAATATALTTLDVTATPGQTPPAPTTLPPQPTVAPILGDPLQISPIPLILTPMHADPDTCQATQRIANTSNKVVGWAWANSITQGDAHFQMNGRQVNSPPSDSGLAPSGQDSVTITTKCSAPSQSYAVLVNDTLGNSYTFALIVQ
jgi:serine/threonine protein kinase